MRLNPGEWLNPAIHDSIAPGTCIQVSSLPAAPHRQVHHCHDAAQGACSILFVQRVAALALRLLYVPCTKASGHTTGRISIHVS